MTNNGEFGERRRSKHRFFLMVAWFALAVIFVGFLKTFVLPSVRGSFHAPLVVYLHGAFLLLWSLLFAAQSMLVQAGQVKRHRTLGAISLVLVPGVVFSTMAIGVFALRRDLAAGGGEIATSSLVGTFSSPLMFALLVMVAIAYRRKPEFHKRLMLLALIAILWPAFFRLRHYFPNVPRPDFWFAFVLPNMVVLIAMLRDKLSLGRVHPVYWTVGIAVVLENFAELMLFDSAGWRVLAHWLAGFFVAA